MMTSRASQEYRDLGAIIGNKRRVSACMTQRLSHYQADVTLF